MPGVKKITRETCARRVDPLLDFARLEGGRLQPDG